MPLVARAQSPLSSNVQLMHRLSMMKSMLSFFDVGGCQIGRGLILEESPPLKPAVQQGIGRRFINQVANVSCSRYVRRMGDEVVLSTLDIPIFYNLGHQTTHLDK